MCGWCGGLGRESVASVVGWVESVWVVGRSRERVGGGSRVYGWRVQGERVERVDGVLTFLS